MPVSARLGQLLLAAMAVLATQMFASTPAAYAQSSPSAYTSGVRYDVMGRAVGTIAPDPDGGGPLKYAATRNTYDVSGNLVKIETGELSLWQSEAVAPANWLGFTVLSSMEASFDIMGRKLKQVAIGSNGVAVSATQYSYDAVGRVECTTARMNPAAYASLPPGACTLGTPGSHGNDRITKNVYNAQGYLHKIQQAVGTVLQQDYATYTYTANGKPLSMTDARGMKATMSYDGHDRQIRWNLPDKVYAQLASATDYEEYGYDANGNRTSLRKRDGSVLIYHYDALGRNTVKVVPERAGLAATHTRDVYYGYDLRGLQTSARFDSAVGQGVGTYFDGFGRPQSSAQDMDGAYRHLRYERDKNGNRIQLTWPDGGNSYYAYDGLGRMSQLLASPACCALVSFSYNNRGLLEYQAAGFTTARYYDAAGRMNSLYTAPLTPGAVFSHGFAFNPAGQITTRTTSNDAHVWTGGANVNRPYAVNGLNQYTSAGATAFTYDANGNLTQSTGTNYTYDVENRLVAVSGAANASLRYDPLGRLYEVASSAGTTRFLHDGDEMIAEYDISGNLLRRYVHGIGSDDPVVWFEGALMTSPAYRDLRANHQGSVVLVADAPGNVIRVNTYDEWGIPGADNIGRFQYTGQAWVPEVGLYYYKARFYSPSLGRFMQTDPIGYDDGTNIYAYVGNDPVNMTDPDGKEGEFNCAKVGTGCGHEMTPQERVSQQETAKNVGMLAAAVIPAGRVIGSIIRFVTRSSAAQNTTKAGTQAAERPKGVPKDFEPSSTSKGGGTKYTDPANPHNNVRDMPGNPNSPNPAQQNPYVKENVSGQPIDAAGRPVSGKSPESHIPRDQYQYRGKIKPDE